MPETKYCPRVGECNFKHDFETVMNFNPDDLNTNFANQYKKDHCYNSGNGCIFSKRK